MKYIIYNEASKMLRKVICPSSQIHSQAKEGEFVMKGTADDATQKVEFDGFDVDGQPINPRVVDKTDAEILADNPTLPEILFEKRTAHITNEQLQNILDRLDDLEK